MPITLLLTVLPGLVSEICITHWRRFLLSSSRIRVIYHNWSATKQRPHLQSVAETSRHSVLSGDKIRQCETSSGSRHKDTDQCLIVAISFCRHRSVPVPCENGSAETTVAEGGRNLVAGLWGHTLVVVVVVEIFIHGAVKATVTNAPQSQLNK